MTSTTQEKEGKAEGFVNKSIDTETSEADEVSEGKSEQSTESSQEEAETSEEGLTQEERKVFMDKFKEQASRKDKNYAHLNKLRQAYTNVTASPERATENDVELIKDFIK